MDYSLTIKQPVKRKGVCALKKSYYIFVLFLLGSMGILFPDARDIAVTFDNIGLEQGLSQLSVNTITRDKNGFMWFGTEDGLNKYDGYNCKIYKHNPDDPTSIPDNHVRVICEDTGDDVLWIGTHGGGLGKLDLKNDTFTNYKHEPGDPLSLSHNQVYSLYIDDSGVLWVGTWGGGLNKFDKEKETFTHYRYQRGNPAGLSHDIVRAIHKDCNGVMWIGTYGGGLNKFDIRTGTFTHYRHRPGRPDSLSNDQVMTICETKNGKMWIGTDGGGVNLFDREEGTFTRYRHNPGVPGSLSHDRIKFIHEDRFGVLWVGTFGGGLNRFDYKTRTFTAFRHNPANLKSLPGDRVLSIYEDDTEMLWIGVGVGGIGKLDLQKKRIHYYGAVPNEPNGLSSANIRTFAEDSDGVLWIGTDGGGLNKFDRKNNKITLYTHNPEKGDSLAYDRIYILYDDNKEEVLWVGTFGGGLDKFDKKKESFIHYKHRPGDPAGLSHNRIRAICEDHTGRLWIGTWGGGLNRYNREKDNFTQYRHKPDTPDSLSHDSVFCIYEDRSGNLWIGTWGGGLNRYHREKDNFTCFRHEPGNLNSLRNDRVLSICEDRDGILWVGSGGRGLGKFDRENNKWSFYSSQEHGLPNDVIYGILEDENGYLWLSSNGGISRFDSKTETFKNYDTEDGLQSSEFNGAAYYKSPSGEMFFGGVNGFNSFFPGAIKDNPYVPPIIITDFKKFNKPVKFGTPLSQVKEIPLSYRDNFISFDFVALNYRTPGKNQYAYMLEGFDREWINCGTRRTASYTNLDSGKYVFRVRGANNDGVWNMEGTSIKLNVIPPVWERWWFLALVTAAIFALVFMFYRYRTLGIRYRNQELEAINTKLERKISERRKKEEQLRRSEEEFRRIFENSIDVYFRSDIKGRLLMISPSGVKILGYADAEEMIGKDIARTFYHNPGERKRLIDTLKKQGTVMDYGMVLVRKDGKKVDVETNARLIYDEKNRPLGLEGILRDITRRKQAEAENIRLQDQLLTAKKMEAVGTLAGGMAHEFNNLMSIIIGNAGLIQAFLIEDFTMRKRVEAILKASNRCAELTDKLLSFSRKQLLKLTRMDVNGLLKGLESAIRRALADEVAIVYQLGQDMQPIKGDSELMLRVVMGIVRNAGDAMPGGGTMTIKTQMKQRENSEEKMVCISFEDTGVGMEKEIIPHIFDPFFTTKPVGEGTGLELSFVYGTVRQHNGWIHVDSDPGKGTTLSMCLPAAEGEKG
ncbi:MAG: PAS domain S-box protein [bacterium]|nr:PAS domain S-box protein [bacterium]